MKRIVNPSPGPEKQPTTQAEVDKFLAHKFNVTKFLFDKQLAFVEDPAPYKIAVCSRRAGKTVACAAHLIDTAIKNRDSVCIYITLSAKNAKRLVWKELLKINRESKLGAEPNSTELSLTFSNGSVVYCSGAKDQSEIENFRGMAIKLCYIDECQSFPAYIEELIDDIIEPALLDSDGKLCLIGTPGPLPIGYFYDCSQSKEWSNHFWTFYDNPHIPIKSGKSHDAFLNRILKRRGVQMSDPSIQREYFGKWVLDSNSLLVRYNSVKNDFGDLPQSLKYHYIMGIDIGFKDADAICILAYSDNDPTTYLVEEKITTKQGITELVEQIQALDKKYKVHKMVMDMGGLGKKIGEELIRRHGIPVEAADKARKMENIELLNDALRTGTLKAKATSRFAQDSYLVEINRDKSRPDKIVVSDSYHSDVIDAVLYAFKCSPAYAWTPEKPKAKYGSREWAEQETDSMFEKELAGFQKAEEFQKWMKGDEN